MESMLVVWKSRRTVVITTRLVIRLGAPRLRTRTNRKFKISSKPQRFSASPYRKRPRIIPETVYLPIRLVCHKSSFHKLVQVRLARYTTARHTG